jgi:tetratricopeptide (TPR) repeat protein
MTQDYYQQGLVKAKDGDCRGAIADFELALISSPEWGEVYYRRGLAYFDLGELLTAVADYTKALTLDPQHRDCYYARALARLTLKNFPGALSDIDRSITFGRDYAPAYQLKGKICRKLAQSSAAIEAYKIAANLYLDQQDSQNSRQCLNLALAIQPQSIENTPTPRSTLLPPLITTEQFYVQLLERGERGDIQGAIEDANWAVQTHPQDVRAYCCRGTLSLKQDDRFAALADFNQAIQIDSESHLAYCSRGKLRSQMGDYGGAMQDFDRALAIDPQDLFIYLARGNVRVNLSNYAEAIDDFDRAIALDPQAPLAYIYRAQAYVKLEELQRAIADYQTAANIYLNSQDLPKYQDTLDRLKQIQSSTPKSLFSPTPDRDLGSIEALRQRLLVLVGGHWAIAQRSIEHLQASHPGRSEQWYLEQAIANLERG